MQERWGSGSSGEGEGSLLACGPGSLGSVADQLEDFGPVTSDFSLFPYH